MNKVKKPAKLSRVIFTRVFVSLVCAVLIIVVALSSVFYQVSEQQSEGAIKARAEAIAAAIDSDSRLARGGDGGFEGGSYEEAATEAPFPASAEAILREQITGEERITLIAADGKVLYDSKINAANLESHATRPEIERAHEVGVGIVARHSQTLENDFLYAAVQLSDGEVVRISMLRQSFLAFLQASAVQIVLIMSAALVVIYFFSRAISQRIMRPFREMSPSAPLASVAYREMRPLFERIDQQKRELREKNAELTEAANMRRVFSSNVTHEMKTPLQVISGYAELISEGIADEDDVVRFAGLIGDEAESMRKLIDDILTLSRLDESALGERSETIDVGIACERCVGRLLPVAAARDINIEVVGECSDILGYPQLFEEALSNLITNAIRYNHDAGSVTITLKDIEDGIAISVTDTGPGIPLDKQDKIFERFFRLDESRSKETGGTGLGLAIVKHVAEIHGGCVSLESSTAGSTFTLNVTLH